MQPLDGAFLLRPEGFFPLFWFIYDLCHPYFWVRCVGLCFIFSQHSCLIIIYIFQKLYKCLHTFNTCICLFLTLKLVSRYTSQGLVPYWFWSRIETNGLSGFEITALLLFIALDLVMWLFYSILGGPHLLSIFDLWLVHRYTNRVPNVWHKYDSELVFLDPHSWVSYPHVQVPSFKIGGANVVPIWFMVWVFLEKTGKKSRCCL